MDKETARKVRFFSCVFVLTIFFFFTMGDVLSALIIALIAAGLLEAFLFSKKEKKAQELKGADAKLKNLNSIVGRVLLYGFVLIFVLGLILQFYAQEIGDPLPFVLLAAILFLAWYVFIRKK